jgi:hypothetical protein
LSWQYLLEQIKSCCLINKKGSIENSFFGWEQRACHVKHFHLFTRVIRLVPLHSPQNYKVFLNRNSCRGWEESLRASTGECLFDEKSYFTFSIFSIWCFLCQWFSSRKNNQFSWTTCSTEPLNILSVIHFPMINSICDRWHHFCAPNWHNELLQLQWDGR